MRYSKIPLIVSCFFIASCAQASLINDSEEDKFINYVNESYNLAEKWFLENMSDKGLFNYLYFPKIDEYSTSNNAIRQLMASRLLAEISSEKPEYLSMHKKNLNFLMKYWYKETEEGIGYVFYNKKSKLGANAMLLRTLLESPLYIEYEKQCKRLKNGIISLIQEDGSFEPWLIPPDYAYDKDYMLTFYSGEALLALVEYYELTKDEDVLKIAKKSQDFYIDRYVNQMDKYYYPAYVPWHTQSLNKLWKITHNKKYADAVFALNDKLLEILDRENELGRFYNPKTPEYGTPHSSSDGVYLEGLAYAYEIAVLSNDSRRQSIYLDAIKLAFGNIYKLQYSVEKAKKYSSPNRAIGGIQITNKKTGIRIDTTQHTMDALRKIIKVYPK